MRSELGLSGVANNFDCGRVVPILIALYSAFSALRLCPKGKVDPEVCTADPKGRRFVSLPQWANHNTARFERQGFVDLSMHSKLVGAKESDEC